ncbi:MAG TPA: glycine cleavage system protein GcvH [Desulfobacteraceae bacterium]|nr:glycine cleavage system protein GcvH [Deltaproteobacteria bacterium]HDI60182.1 glycine cleavage system protein GcvH [Desulfobacteraceae bacterium]
MKEINELNLPEDLRYADDHEWLRPLETAARIGISDYAQDQLGDIVYVELPAVGRQLAKGEEFGTVESVKAVSSLYMPVGGEVTAVNEQLAEAPELVNTDPYGQGWMIEVKVADPAEVDALMDRAAYLKALGG